MKRTKHRETRDISGTAPGRRPESSTALKKPRAAEPGGAKRAPFPQSVDPELPSLVREVPAGSGWLHEMKLDGYRMIAAKRGGDIRFLTRNHLDWTGKVPHLAAAVAKLRVREAIFDGEVVVFDDRGITDFQLLQNAFRDEPERAIYVVFDLLYLDGIDLSNRPLDERKDQLARLKLPVDRGPLRMSEFVVGNGPRFFSAAERLGLEGVVSKRRQSLYVGGRTTDWIKIKSLNRAEFVIGGYTDPGGTRKGFGSLLLGVYDNKRRLNYAGRVGTGFSQRTIAEIAPRLTAIEQPASPFSDSPLSTHAKGVHWVRPRLVAQVAFSNWTRDGLLRHPSFQGLREDKPARSVRADTPRPLATAASQRAGRKHSL